jgi:signal transduction histidine kinase
MGNMKKLSAQTFKAFVLYAAVVLACSIPAYYFIIEWIWSHELKEHNRIVSESVKQRLISLELTDAELPGAIGLWSKLQPDTKLQAVDKVKPDSTYNTYRLNKYIRSKGYDRFQGLVTCFEINGKPYSLTVEINMEESDETILAITSVTVLFFVILLVGLIFLNRRLSARLWQPFYGSLRKITGFELNSQQQVQFDETTIEEFAILNASLDKLITANIATYQQQKEFTENASHELQTPLAIVQSKLDLLLQSHSLTQEQSENIEETNRALSRVARINKNLLLLARIENSQFTEKEPVCLSTLLKTNMTQLADFATDKRLVIESQMADGIVVSANRGLVEILLNNLLLNAIRHNTIEGKISITLSADQFIVANTGIAPLNQENLFRRFSNASTETPGSGLGLAITKEIASRYGWCMGYNFGEQQHVFTVQF